MGGLNGQGAVKQMLQIKEIVRAFFCHSERKLRDIRRGLRATNAFIYNALGLSVSYSISCD